MQAVAQALVERGHDVVWLTSADNERRVVAVGASFAPTKAIAAVDAPLAARWVTGLFDGDHQRTANWMRAQVADYRAVLSQGFAPDVLLVDVMPHGAKALYELGELPAYATLGVIPMYTSSAAAPMVLSGGFPASSWLNLLINGVRQRFSQYVSLPLSLQPLLNRERAAVGLRRLEFGATFESMCYSPALHIQASSPSLEFNHVSQQPDQKTVFVGPLVTQSKASSIDDLPAWWDQVLAHTCVIGVTQGTLAMDPTSLIIPAIQALSSDRKRLLVVVSPHEDRIRAAVDCPDNVLIASFLPYSLLLPQLSLFVTNGGYGSVTQALSHKVPLICAGRSEDKKDTAARVVWCGAGIDLKVDNPTENQVHDAADCILIDDTYRLEAARLGDELNDLGGAKAACDALEELVKSVLKSDQ
jgi:UDP:flavonoid glycosyltransferase YjiC (YdhE family)